MKKETKMQELCRLKILLKTRAERVREINGKRQLVRFLDKEIEKITSK